MIQRHRVSKCCWGNGAEKLAQRRVATDLQLVKKKKKNAVSAKYDKVKHNKARCACSYLWFSLYAST